MSKAYQGLRFLNEETDDAVIEIYGEIGYEGWDKEQDENTARQMSSELSRLKSLKSKTITVKINSPGGDVSHALAIHDLLAEHPAQITTQINGLCASAATVIAMAGSTRKMSRNALFLIHQCSAYVGRANETQLRQEMETQQQVNERLLAIYASRCPDKEQDLRQLLEANNGQGRWLDADEAKQFGFVTDIYNESRKAASVSLNCHAMARLPQLPDSYAYLATTESESSALQDLLQALKNLLPKTDKKQNHPAMKNIFPIIAATFALADETAYKAEDGFAFNNQQLQIMEQRLKELSDLKQSLEALKAEKQSADQQLSDLTAERDRLKAIVDALPGETPKVSGDDTDTPKDDFADYVSKSPLYAELKKEI